MFKKLLAVLITIGLMFGSINLVFAEISKANPVEWKTETVSLFASDFYISVDGKTFLPDQLKTQVHSDPGDITYTTLEISWVQNSIKMQMNLYFNANSTHYWISEIRVYDGKKPSNWITQKQEYFRNNLKRETEIKGVYAIKMSDNASIYFENLRLSVNFLNKKLKTENRVPICSELFLKKGTIIRTSNFSAFAYPINEHDPKFENLFVSDENHIIVQLNEDLLVYLTDGGFVTSNYKYLSDYLKDLETIGEKTEELSVHLIDEKWVMLAELEHSKMMQQYYRSIATDYGLQITELKKQIEELKKTK